MAYGGKNDGIIYDVTWPWKVKFMILSQTATSNITSCDLERSMSWPR